MNAPQESRPVPAQVLVNAVREVLRDCPQGVPLAAYYPNAEQYAIARAQWAIASKLRPALLLATGEQI